MSRPHDDKGPDSFNRNLLTALSFQLSASITSPITNRRPESSI